MLETATDSPAASGNSPALPNGVSNVSDMIATFNAAISERDQLVAERRAAGIGGIIDDYKVSLDGMVDPNGQPIVLDENHPLLKRGREWAFRHGIKVSEFNELAKLEVKRQLDEHQAFEDLAKAEHAKLGENADRRKAAVAQALRGRLGAKAQPLLAVIELNATAVEALEALIRTTAAPPYIPGGRGTASPDLSRMSAEERIENARQAQAYYRHTGNKW